MENNIFNFDRKGLMKSDTFHLGIILVFAIAIVFIGSFAMAGTMVGVVNVTNLSGGQINATFNYNTSGNGSTGKVFLVTTVNSLKINEDVVNRFNLTISHIAVTENLTGINITLPSTFAFYVKSNATGNTSGTTWVTSVWFNATGVDGSTNPNGSILAWNATAGLATASGYIINNTGGGNATQVAFNTSAWTPGIYNLTVRFIYNNTPTLAAVYNETNITVIVNDTTKPDEVNVTVGVGRLASLTYSNISGALTVNVSVVDNGNFTQNIR